MPRRSTTYIRLINLHVLMGPQKVKRVRIVHDILAFEVSAGWECIECPLVSRHELIAEALLLGQHDGR